MCRYCAVTSAPVEQADGPLSLARRQVHVAHRRRQMLVPGELLDRLRRRPSHREMRAERVSKDVHVASGCETRSSLRSLDPVT